MKRGFGPDPRASLAIQAADDRRGPYHSVTPVSPALVVSWIMPSLTVLSLIDPEGHDPAGDVEAEVVREDVAQAEEDASAGDGHAAVRAADGDRGELVPGRVEGVEVRVG